MDAASARCGQAGAERLGIVGSVQLETVLRRVFANAEHHGDDWLCWPLAAKKGTGMDLAMCLQNHAIGQTLGVGTYLTELRTVQSLW